MPTHKKLRAFLARRSWLIAHSPVHGSWPGDFHTKTQRREETRIIFYFFFVFSCLRVNEFWTLRSRLLKIGIRPVGRLSNTMLRATSYEQRAVLIRDANHFFLNFALPCISHGARYGARTSMSAFFMQARMPAVHGRSMAAFHEKKDAHNLGTFLFLLRVFAPEDGS